MSILVVPYSDEWPAQFAAVAEELARALSGVPVGSIEHVGSTAVPGLAAKPIIDIDIIVGRPDLVAAIAALEAAGYEHAGDLGLPGREAFRTPDQRPARHVYLCVEGTLHLRNHLAVRDVLRRDALLRQRYGEVKLALAGDAEMDIDTYIAGKSGVLQEVLASSDLTIAEKAQILALNDPDSRA
ncbi:GrpB family protein [Microbacterium arabinogalactanolyticum]|uniref:GrpB family protein n=1 Tax=Microbacterium arabinogalactanolyticum TaxID=69365 RepID=UPI0025551394|nr:GrpB family protein [Microbacterium arabinogalactanolyticum]GLC84353.1 hypothetical protein MIAR_09410 [Microbacterium arabinogalactanolyticum]